VRRKGFNSTFTDVLPSRSLGLALNKLNLTRLKQTTQEQYSLSDNQKNTQNAKPKQTQKTKLKLTRA